MSFYPNNACLQISHEAFQACEEPQLQWDLLLLAVAVWVKTFVSCMNDICVISVWGEGRKGETKRSVVLVRAEQTAFSWNVTGVFVLNFQSRARQEDPEQARLKQKAKEVSFVHSHHWTALTLEPSQLHLHSKLCQNFQPHHMVFSCVGSRTEWNEWHQYFFFLRLRMCHQHGWFSMVLNMTAHQSAYDEAGRSYSLFIPPCSCFLLRCSSRSWLRCDNETPTSQPSLPSARARNASSTHREAPHPAQRYKKSHDLCKTCDSHYVHERESHDWHSTRWM